MKKLFAAVFMGVLFFSTQAHAVFTYVPEGPAPDAPIIQENAIDVFAGNPAPQAAPLVIPQEQVVVQERQIVVQPMQSQAVMPNQSIDPKVGIGPSTASQQEIAKAEALIRKAKNYEQKATQQKKPVKAQKAVQPVQPQQPVYQPAPVAYQPIQPVYQPTPVYQNAMMQGAPALVIGKGSLREQLMTYAGSMGYQVAWNCPNDLIVTNETVFSSGTFAGNLRELFETLQHIGHRDMSATLFQGNRTIVIEPARR